MEQDPKPEKGEVWSPRVQRLILTALILLGSWPFLLKPWIETGAMPNSAALYVGVPIILSLALVWSPKAKSAVGAVLKGITIALLMSAVVFGSGSICILFAAPLFYGIGGVIGRARDKDRKARNGTTLRTAAVVSMFIVLALEGTQDAFTFERNEFVAVTKIVDAGGPAVESKLAKTPRFDRPLPGFLRIGFPVPAATSGSGLAIGDRRSVFMLDRSKYLWSDHRIDGAVVFEVAARGADWVRFVPISDESHIDKWLAWTTSEVRWRDLGDGTTEVTWTLHFVRKLDPVWYFAPLQRYAAGLAAEVLIDNLATPDA